MSKALFILIASMMIFALLAGCEQAPAGTPTLASSASKPEGYPAAVANPTLAESNPGYPAPVATTEGYPAPGSGLLRVTSASGQVKPLAVPDLGQLTKAVVGTETGPTLGDVLLLAGIKDFTSVSITGSNGTLELTKDKLSDQVIISLVDNSTFTLVVAGTPAEQWIKDISAITVK